MLGLRLGSGLSGAVLAGNASDLERTWVTMRNIIGRQTKRHAVTLTQERK